MNEPRAHVVPLEVDRAIDQLCDEFEASWRAEHIPDIRSFLNRIDARYAGPLLRALLPLELAYRASRGEPLSLPHYAERWPEHGADVRRAFAEWEASRKPDAENATAPQHRSAGGDSGRVVRNGTPGDGTRDDDACESMPESIGRYRVIGKLGSGGQADVYRAVHPALEREVVIKLARRPLPDAPSRNENLVAEGKLLAGLKHPNVASVFDLDLYDGRPFLVMDYIRGCNLRQYVERQSIEPVEAALLVARLARAVAAAHARGVVHQDIKPENVIIDSEGKPRLIDFGFAAVRHAWQEDKAAPGSVVGTVAFMPPEQARGETSRIGPRTDVFALGAVLYDLLVGKAPFAANEFDEAWRRARQCEFDTAPLDRPGIPRSLRAICVKAMSAEPQARYTSAGELAADLQAVVDFPKRQRKRMAMAAVGIGSLLAVVLAGVLVWGPRDRDAGANGDMLKRAPDTVAGLSIADMDGHDDVGDGPPAQDAGPAIPDPLPATIPSEAAEDRSQRKPTTETPLAARIENSLGMEVVLIHPGTFTMGSEVDRPEGQSLEDDRYEPPTIEFAHANPDAIVPRNAHLLHRRGGRSWPAHRVQLTKPYYIGKQEVTQREWKAVMRDNPSQFQGRVDLPVHGVDRWEAIRFCYRLSVREQRIYRLPTEAEWEYACRGGVNTCFVTGDRITPEDARFSTDGPKPVGSFPPNAFGLHDMHGNVEEWVADFYMDYRAEAQIDPRGLFVDRELFDGMMGQFVRKVVFNISRGGNWASPPSEVTCHFRRPITPATMPRLSGNGFRVVLDPNLPFNSTIEDYDRLHPADDWEQTEIMK
ncbi:MAG: bifunctional serine/threonine-protein kinase/formylglycine-generating enzyme family protein [Thermoguttaceae bacterium]|jgi:formylglycine-generating enzyme required for sulfatase activity/tRNA A-37 threonylcarbamoyl transferase component Bud32|nr:bifunctional serine/threonine-protein kinase/formylglycine-generating enzyme family protein [Thermoguttaceae bacterium]